MIVQVDDTDVFVATGGRDFDPDGNVVVFIHGAGMDRTVWHLQSRWLAHHGYSVAAVDLPGHGNSGGEPPTTVESYSSWLSRFLDALGAPQVTLVGHSLGSFVALETAAREPQRITHLVMMSTAEKMPVHPDMLHSAATGTRLLVDLVTSWGLAKEAQLGGNPTPGAWMTGGVLRLLERQRPGILGNDMNASHDYHGALEAAVNVKGRVLLILGAKDRMTPVRKAAPLIEAFNDVTVEVIEAAGHMMNIETPDETVDALARFLTP